MYLVDQPGHCPICEKSVRFTAKHDWYRDHLLCSGCGFDTQRARTNARDPKCTTQVIEGFKYMKSSPGNRGVSPKLQNDCIGIFNLTLFSWRRAR